MPPGQPGEIVVTHLGTRDFPFVRYRTGDIATLDDRALRLRTRLADAARDPGPDDRLRGGRRRHRDARPVADLCDARPSRSECVPDRSGDAPACTRVELVADPAFDPRVRDTIVAGFKSRLGRDVEIEVEMVDTIPAERSGKYRYVVSHALDRA